jgi:hypothetical protein
MYQVWSKSIEGCYAVTVTLTKLGHNPLKDLDSRVFTRMLCGKKFDPLTFDLENQ